MDKNINNLSHKKICQRPINNKGHENQFVFINKSHIKKSVTQIPHKYPASEKSHNNQTTLTICIRLKAVYIVYVTKEFKNS